MREYKIQSFKDKEFKAIRGVTHPQYSIDTFEKEEKDFRNKYWNIKKDDVVFDIGTSYGSYSLTACVMGAIVYSFEPEKTVFVDLVNNIRLNDWFSRCFPFNIGLWSKKVIMNMKSYAPHWPEYTISGDYQMETLDHIVEMAQIEKLNWIKVDVEGAEEEVFKGGLKTIEKFHPNLIIECHTFLDKDLDKKIKNILKEYNYRFEEVEREPNIIIVAE